MILISSLRKKMFDIFAKYYEEYGIPGICGWIDTLLLLEPQDRNENQWTQRSISRRLQELFPVAKYPTSVPSINRAIKINEKYGTVLKKGSHKTGYRYIPTTGTEMITKIFEGFIDKTNICISDLKVLSKEIQDTDPTLKKITEEQILGYNAYVQLLEYALSYFEEKLSDWDTNAGE